MFHRCRLCGRLIWPWQRPGWSVYMGTVNWHHGKCWRLAYWGSGG